MYPYWNWWLQVLWKVLRCAVLPRCRLGPWWLSCYQRSNDSKNWPEWANMTLTDEFDELSRWRRRVWYFHSDRSRMYLFFADVEQAGLTSWLRKRGGIREESPKAEATGPLNCIQHPWVIGGISPTISSVQPPSTAMSSGSGPEIARPFAQEVADFLKKCRHLGRLWNWRFMGDSYGW